MIRESMFRPAWWLRHRHLQTIFPNFPLRRFPPLELVRETVELPDGDFLHVDWHPKQPDGAPLVLLLHGLEGSVQSPYARTMLERLSDQGWRCALMHFRSCSGVPNRMTRSYHAGETGDLQTIIDRLRERDADAPLVAIGYSLGGNVLLKWLGERGPEAPLTAAAAISVPFDLQDACHAMNIGFSRVYRNVLLGRLKSALDRKFPTGRAPGVPVRQALNSSSFIEFDDILTAPLHGFASVYDYYRRCSSRQFLKDIAVPTLIVNARDDPFMTPSSVPSGNELSQFVELELSEHGGHVGFISGKLPWKPDYWLLERIPEFLSQHLEVGETGRSGVGEKSGVGE